jgi:hypothetical protein
MCQQLAKSYFMLFCNRLPFCRFLRKNVTESFVSICALPFSSDLAKLEKQSNKGEKAMESKAEVRGQAEQLGLVIDMLVAMIGAIRDAFIHQQSRLLDDLGKQQQNLVEEVAFAMALADEQMVGLPTMSRKPFIRYQSILLHLRIAAEAIQGLGEVARLQIREGIPFSDKAIDHTRLLLDGPEKILRTLAETVRSGDGERLQEIAGICRELGRSCLQFATDHESRLVEGLCLPKAAPLFLTLIDRVQTLIHHELETVKLLSSDIEV